DYYLSLRGTGYDMIGYLGKQLNGSWEPLRALSMWQASSILPFERHLLRYNSHSENLWLAEELLANYPGGNRSSVDVHEDMRDSLHACLESTMTD
ncbi:MAG: hypothetical protein H7293_02215, partial [Candidatus Saccharibacteria bacterium]|nr:hypothetical protein [Rhodoferax sp.]